MQRSPQRSTAGDALDSFMGELRSLPLLPHDRVKALAETARREEDAFRQALAEIPAVSVLVVERWRSRCEEGRVTAMLSQGYRDDRSQDWSAFIDERLGCLRQLIAGWERLADGPKAQRLEVEREMADVLLTAWLVFELLQETALHVRGLLDTPATAATRHRKRALGLNRREARAALARAEAALARRDEARQVLTAHNLRMVVNIAKRYRGQGVAFADLIQEGSIGLVRAVDKFDPALGYRFSTYAVWWIEQAMIRAIQKLSRTVRLPSHVYEEQVRYRRAEESLRGRLDRDPGAREISHELGIDEGAVERLHATTFSLRSLDAPRDDDDERPLGEAMTDPDGLAADEFSDIARASDALAGALKQLDERERKVVTCRFGLAGSPELTLQQIGDQLGLSRERVRQIGNEAIEKLRRHRGVQRLAQLVTEGEGD